MAVMVSLFSSWLWFDRQRTQAFKNNHNFMKKSFNHKLERVGISALHVEVCCCLFIFASMLWFDGKYIEIDFFLLKIVITDLHMYTIEYNFDWKRTVVYTTQWTHLFEFYTNWNWCKLQFWFQFFKSFWHGRLLHSKPELTIWYNFIGDIFDCSSFNNRTFDITGLHKVCYFPSWFV